jgi:hypothetical protein
VDRITTLADLFGRDRTFVGHELSGPPDEDYAVTSLRRRGRRMADSEGHPGARLRSLTVKRLRLLAGWKNLGALVVTRSWHWQPRARPAGTGNH